MKSDLVNCSIKAKSTDYLQYVASSDPNICHPVTPVTASLTEDDIRIFHVSEKAVTCHDMWHRLGTVQFWLVMSVYEQLCATGPGSFSLCSLTIIADEGLVKKKSEKVTLYA